MPDALIGVLAVSIAILVPVLSIVAPVVVAVRFARGMATPIGAPGNVGMLVGSVLLTVSAWTVSDKNAPDFFVGILAIYLVGLIQGVAFVYHLVGDGSSAMARSSGSLVLACVVVQVLIFRMELSRTAKCRLLYAHLFERTETLDKLFRLRGRSYRAELDGSDPFHEAKTYAAVPPQCPVRFPRREAGSLALRVKMAGLDMSEWTWTEGGGWILAVGSLIDTPSRGPEGEYQDVVREFGGVPKLVPSSWWGTPGAPSSP